MGKLAVLAHEVKVASSLVEDVVELARQVHDAERRTARAQDEEDARSWAQALAATRNTMRRSVTTIVKMAAAAPAPETELQRLELEMLNMQARVAGALLEHAAILEARAWERALELPPAAVPA